MKEKNQKANPSLKEKSITPANPTGPQRLVKDSLTCGLSSLFKYDFNLELHSKIETATPPLKNL